MASLGIFIKNPYLQRFITQTHFYLELKFGCNSLLGNPGAGGAAAEGRKPGPRASPRSLGWGGRPVWTTGPSAQVSPRGPVSCWDRPPGLVRWQHNHRLAKAGTQPGFWDSSHCETVSRGPSQGLWGAVGSEEGEHSGDLGGSPPHCPVAWPSECLSFPSFKVDSSCPEAPMRSNMASSHGKGLGEHEALCGLPGATFRLSQVGSLDRLAL